MIVTGKHIARRAFLRGTGVALALPLLDAMVPAFAATRVTAAKPVCRMGVVYVPNGIIMDKWTPAADGAAFELTPILQPLAAFKDQLSVLSGLAHHNGYALGDGAGDHARAGATFLTGVHPKKTEGTDIRCGISIDQIAARELGKRTQLASLEVSLEPGGMAGGCDSGYSCAYTNTISWRGETSPVPMEANPRAVFERLFGDGDTTDPVARLERDREDRSILDFVRDDVARMRTGLGARDRGKLDQHLDAIRDIERRIQMAEEQSASMKVPVLERPAGVPDEFEDYYKLMVDLQVVALQADLTRVTTFMVAHEGSNRAYRSIGVPDPHHGISHHQNDPEKIAKLTKINTLHTKMFAYYLGKLRSTPDGEGTLLDHSMILYGSSLADGNQHTHDHLPLLLAGGGGGQIKSGRHVRYEKETPMTNLLVTMADKMGVACENLGDSTGKLRDLGEV